MKHPDIAISDTWPSIDGQTSFIQVLCPECGQLEWWEKSELTDHGKCRATNAPCPVCGEE